MANEKVSLSQNELDKLFGIKTTSTIESKEEKTYKTDKFLSDSQETKLKNICVYAYKYFKLAIRAKFGEGESRKLTITSLFHHNIDEFFDNLTSGDFLYEARFGKAKMYIKFDSLLLCSLAGIKKNIAHKTNTFQSEVLKEFVAKPLALGFARQLKSKKRAKIISLYEKDKNSFKTQETGICITVCWNENLNSLGIEKLFLTEELINDFRAIGN